MPPARSKARKRALDVLFEAELRGLPVLELLAERITLGSPPVPAYAADLVRGVTVHAARIDELISQYAEGWTLDRMPAVDRNVLRIGVYELLWAPDVPDGVAISEAVLLARDLSTDASPAFINGLLARIAGLKPSLQKESGPGEADAQAEAAQDPDEPDRGQEGARDHAADGDGGGEQQEHLDRFEGHQDGQAHGGHEEDPRPQPGRALEEPVQSRVMGRRLTERDDLGG
jgi:transcription antitermination protein NusB